MCIFAAQKQISRLNESIIQKAAVDYQDRKKGEFANKSVALAIPWTCTRPLNQLISSMNTETNADLLHSASHCTGNCPFRSTRRTKLQSEYQGGSATKIFQPALKIKRTSTPSLFKDFHIAKTMHDVRYSHSSIFEAREKIECYMRPERLSISMC
ncbi:predicted protein [Sclerotinia sclerotiorum 1980 UF-70]|uniref:Uncharacterized protein n=1 Tax=Sclerotinia sclerotiorum (strain ATCC 18683 / 1980 / Ss-1) TaxID=665079 RepID=A7E546_SCLS1|nr:predicted protein [Sclerotinia sclerotiorum 1980 UF-70]EDN91018.1 predicted protein [Sclerotinia sclerotiorum 1980 UF-70]